jgi:predicted methyltransferase
MKYRIDEHRAPILHSFGLKAHPLMTTTNAMPDSSERRCFPAALSARAVSDQGRPAVDLAQDLIRKPAELLTFSEIRSGDRVIDVWPGTGYWTRLFSSAVGITGRVIGLVPEEIASFKSDPVGVVQRVAQEPGRSNIDTLILPLAAPPSPSFQSTLDLVWVFESYHDFYNPFMREADVSEFNRSVFQQLKSGGRFVIVDHAVREGSGLTHTSTLHRIEPSRLRVEIEAVGFRFDAETTVLANPNDPRSARAFEPSVRGQTDRFAYRFVKP